MKGCLFIIGASVVNAILWALWSGFVLSVIWEWFVTSTFHAPQITIPVAIGLCLVARMLTVTTPEKPDQSDASKLMDQLIYSYAFDFFFPLFVLVIGYVAHLFV